MPADNPSTPVAVDPVRAAAPPRDFFSRLLSKFRPAVIFDDGMGDDDLQKMLADAIKGAEPAFDWICAVYQDTGVVIYMTYIYTYNHAYGEYKYWRRTYTLAADGKSVTLGADAIQVKPKRVWETIKDQAQASDNDDSVTTAQAAEVESGAETPALRAACACESQSQTQAQSQLQTSQGENIMAASTERVNAVKELITAGKFTEADRAALELLSESGFKALTAPVAPASMPTPAPTTLTAPTTLAAPANPATPATLTETQALEACPSLKSLVARVKAADDARKADLVSKLKGAQKVHDEAALNLKSLDQLEEIAALVGLDSVSPVDYSLRGIPSHPAAETRTASEIPDGWMQALERGRGASNTQAN